MIYGLLLKHIELVNPTEPIRAELRPPALDSHNPDLNGEGAPAGAPPSPRFCFCG
jgi:hypothetical protein